MKFLQPIIDNLAKLPDTFKTADMITVMCAGLVVLFFLIFVVVILVAKPRFAKVAKKITKQIKESDNNAASAMKQLPPDNFKAWVRRNPSDKAGDVFSVDSCVNNPYNASVAPAAPVILGFITMLATALAALMILVFEGMGLIGLSTEGLLAIILTAFVGALFTLILFIISRSAYKGEIKAYDRFCAAVDGANIEDSRHSMPRHQHPVNFSEASANEQPVYNPIDDEPVAYNASFDNDTSFDNNVITDADVVAEPIFQPQVEIETEDAHENQAAEARAKAQAEEAARAAAEAHAAEEAVKAEAEAKARAEAEAKARAEAEAKAAADAAAAKAAADAAAAKAAADAAAAKAAADAAAAQAEPEDIVTRIDRMVEQGASPAQMREVIGLLQQERAKPNKTPEQTKRLTEALAKLLKAMNSNRG